MRVTVKELREAFKSAKEESDQLQYTRSIQARIAIRRLLSGVPDLEATTESPLEVGDYEASLIRPYLKSIVHEPAD